MFRSVPLVTIYGTAIRLHWTFLIVMAVLMTAVTVSNGFVAALQMALLIGLIFGCVVLHEFGHITVARRFGIETPELVLLPIGGLAKLKRIPTDPRQELAIAIAGPAVNFAIFALLVVALGRWPNWSAFAELSEGNISLVEQLAIFNLAVGLFNLLPAFPMDGGRILRAWLAYVVPRHKATQIASKVGQSFAFVMGLFGLMSGNVLLVAIGIFIFLAASTEAQVDKIRHAIGGTPVSHVMVTGQVQLMVTDPIERAAEAILHSDNEEFPVLNRDGSLAGFLLRPDILESVAHSGSQATAGQKMRSDIPLVPTHFRAEEAADMIAGGAPIVGVVDGSGRFAGLVNWRNLLDALAINEAMRQRHEEAHKRTSL